MQDFEGLTRGSGDPVEEELQNDQNSEVGQKVCFQLVQYGYSWKV